MSLSNRWSIRDRNTWMNNSEVSKSFIHYSSKLSPIHTSTSSIVFKILQVEKNIVYIVVRPVFITVCNIWFGVHCFCVFESRNIFFLNFIVISARVREYTIETYTIYMLVFPNSGAKKTESKYTCHSFLRVGSLKRVKQYSQLILQNVFD